MNLPNKLTLSRMILTPVLFCWYFSNDVIKGIPVVVYALVLAILYGLMELSDLIDGKLARKKMLVTDLGKIMDPFADVICHITFFTCFVVSRQMPVLAFMIILWRELLQCFMRMLLMGKGKAMPANIFGKTKTCLYALSCFLGLAWRIIIVCGYSKMWMNTTMIILFYLSAFSSCMSFLIYMANTFKSGVLNDITR